MSNDNKMHEVVEVLDDSVISVLSAIDADARWTKWTAERRIGLMEQYQTCLNTIRILMICRN